MMELEKLAICGASGFSLVVADIIRLGNKYEIIGYLDDINIGLKGTNSYGSVILGGEEGLVFLKESGIKNIIIGFGDCKGRLKKTQIIKEKGFVLAKAFHPSAIIAKDATIGNGTVVGAGAIVDPYARIGESALINRGALIGHECVIEDGAHIGPGANLAGNVTIGRGTFVGIGSSIIERLRIGSNSIIGAGSVVNKDIPDDVLAYGVPAKVIRKL